MKNYKYLIMILLLLLNVAVEATVVELKGTKAQTSKGEEFIFNFFQDEVLPSDGSDGVLIIQARGDYKLGSSISRFENIEIKIDGFDSLQKEFGPYGATNSNLLTSFEENDDNEWRDSSSVSGLDLISWTSDRQIQILVHLSDGVNIGLGAQDSSAAYVDVTLQYSAVPIPLSIWLFATGIFSLFGMRRFTAKSE